MTASANSPRRVRRSLLVLLGVAVLLALHMAADFVEGRRLANAVARVPDVFKIDLPRPPIPPAKDAYPYYRAAAVFAGADHERINAVNRRLETVAGGTLDDDLRAEARAVVVNSEAWPLVDRGRPRVLRGFGPQEVWDFAALDSLVGAKTLYAALTGDASTSVAASSLDFDLSSHFDASIASIWWLTKAASLVRLQVVLNRTQPTAEDLARLSLVLASLDRDDQLTTQVAARLHDNLDRGLYGLGGQYDVIDKVGMLGATWVSIGVRAIRPYLAAELASRLEHYPEVLDALQRPWPERIDAVPRALRKVDPADFERSIVVSSANLAVTRAARVTVAIERFRRANAGEPPHDLAALVPTYLDAVPIDPFSGQPLRFARTGVGYAVYSVGLDRKDDGGAFTGLERFARPVGSGPGYAWPNVSADIGIRISK